jgi:hypothetical protein
MVEDTVEREWVAETKASGIKWMLIKWTILHQKTEDRKEQKSS